MHSRGVGGVLVMLLGVADREGRGNIASFKRLSSNLIIAMQSLVFVDRDLACVLNVW